MIYLIDPEKKQHKANLHAHTVISDGKMTPEELKEMYKSHGYSILSITDHETPHKHTNLTDGEFIAITGYETYVRKTADCKYDVYDQEIHINLFARDPDNEAIVCYNPKYCKYITQEQKDALVKVGTQETRQYTVEYVNNLIATAKENGYIAAYNHPWWSMEREEDILAYEGFFSMEMCNYGAHQLSRLEYNGALYDKMLRAGKRIACHAADDNHNTRPEGDPLCDSFGGFAMIMPETFTYGAIIDAMEQGNMYSSMGPTFKQVYMEGNKIHIECSDVERIMVFTGSKSPKKLVAQPGQTINCADFEIDDRAMYVRVSIMDQYCNFADTRGFFRDELEF